MRNVQALVYILSNDNNTLLCPGMVSETFLRSWRNGQAWLPAQAVRYGAHKLVYYEMFVDLANAEERERQIRNSTPAVKRAAVESMNPRWEDLKERLFKETQNIGAPIVWGGKQAPSGR